MTTPEEAVTRVTDLPGFLTFLEALAHDRRAADHQAASAETAFGHAAGGWENGDIAGFLEATAAALRDGGIGDAVPSWREFAEILLAGKYYE